MRAAGTTPEPFGQEPADTGSHRFVIHQHDATRLHFDLRLEYQGVLLSWAVPRHIPCDPSDKRLAVETEPHPIEYAEFEGVIPDGNYGAGAMIAWDRGHWEPREPFDAGLKKGKLLFELFGFKVRGVFTLVRTKRAPKDWLLIKKPDAWARPGEPVYDPTSVLSGLSVESLIGADARRAELVLRLDAAGARVGSVDIRSQRPMLAKTGDAPFTNDDWLFELKYDGFRALLGKEASGTSRVFYRSGRDATALFPDLVRPLEALVWRGLVLDGEIVVVDADGRPWFNGIQNRGLLAKAREIERAAVLTPVTYFAFDLLAAEGRDLRGLPLEVRKAFLREILPPLGALKFADHVEAEGEALYAEIERRGLEGVMGKRRTSPYRPGRSDDWLKFPLERHGDFVVVGLNSPKGSRVGFGSLLLAGRGDDGELRYVGRVGSGFSTQDLEAITAELSVERLDRPPFVGSYETEGDPVWVPARHVLEVRFKEWSPDRHLRMPIYIRRRADKMVADIDRIPASGDGDPLPPEPVSIAQAGRELVVTNRDKVYFPEHGLTKGDLVDYYVAVAPWLLPLLDDRPLVLTRFPDGIHGKSFFQKDAPAHVPDWLRRERMWSEENGRVTDFVIADSAEALGWIANSGTIPIHVWQSRIATIQTPDFSVLDLDPKGAPFSDVVTIALALRDLCERVGITSVIKTSGSTGLHVMIPLGRLVTYEQSRMISMLLAKIVILDLGEIATTTRRVDARDGKVYIDTLQNGHGRLIVGPYSVRARPGAPVSTPLRWDEVGPSLDPDAFTIQTVIERLEVHGDPMAGLIDEVPDLGAVVERLSECLAARG
mgnify:CR=1 FL=1